MIHNEDTASRRNGLRNSAERSLTKNNNGKEKERQEEIVFLLRLLSRIPAGLAGILYLWYFIFNLTTK